MGSWDPLERTLEERLDAAMRRKDEGNSFFKGGANERALAAYEFALRALGLPSFTLEQTRDADESMAWKDALRREARSKIGLACNLNAAQCCLQLEWSAEAMHYASHALELDPQSTKALYR